MRSRTRTRRPRPALLLTCLLVALLALAGAGSAQAACTGPFNCFAGDDGDQAHGPGDLSDWQDIAGSVTAAYDPARGSDTKFSGGDKETEPGGWDFITGNNTPKTDIVKGWSSFDGRFLYAAFERVKQSGNTFLAFELNQDAAGPRTSGGIAVPHRSEGDILFTYDIATTERLSFGMCSWRGDENAGDWVRIGDGVAVGGRVKQCTRLSASSSPAAIGAVNWSAAIDPSYLTDFKPIGAGRFGEAVVDLGVLGGRFLSDACGQNGWFWMHSRAAESVVSQPKDVLEGNPIASPTCGLAIDKKVSLSGAPGTFVDADQANPLAARVGDTLTYSISVENTGSAALAVDLSEPRCDAGTLTGPDGRDGVGDPLAAGAKVAYTCTRALTGSDPDPLVNTACATATATLGSASKTLDAVCDSAVVDVTFAGGQAGALGEPGNAPTAQTTAPEQQPGQVVLGERILAPGRARLLGARNGCLSRAFRPRVRGRNIARVVFTLDGRRIKTLRRTNFRGSYAVRVNPRRLKVGVHRLVVKVTFERGSATKAKTYRFAFQRCPRALRAPRFTG